MDGLSMNKNESAMIPEPPSWGGTGESAPAVPLLKKVKAPFAVDRRDSYFALFAFVLGFLFVRWVLFSWQGWGVTLFTLLFCGSVTVYMLKKGVQVPRAG